MAGIGQGIKEFFVGAPGSIESYNKFSPREQSVRSNLFDLLQNPSQGFAPIANQARSQFSQNTIPSLAERFSSLGSNSQSSPAFAQQIGQAGAGLDEGLAALQSQYGQQGISQLLQLLGNPEEGQIHNPASEGILHYGAKSGIDALFALLTGGLSSLGGKQQQNQQQSQFNPQLQLSPLYPNIFSNINGLQHLSQRAY